MKGGRKGSYILLIELWNPQAIEVGSLREIYFLAGNYAYVGSAMGGFASRLPHHFRENKKPHWHLDYLLQKAEISSVIISDSQVRNECTIAKALMTHFQCIPGFGRSDCKCKSHLFCLNTSTNAESGIVKLLGIIGCPSETINNKSKP